MNILLSTEPTEVVLGLVYWILIILGIIILVKFFQIAKDVRSIKENIEEIKATPQKQKLADTIKNTIKTDDEKQDKIMLFFNECSQLYKRCNSKEEFESKVEDIIAKYNKKGDFDYSTLKSGLWEQYKQL
jgi:biopolymer transport protein ExbB/TolQ